MPAPYKGRGPRMFPVALTGKEIHESLSLFETTALQETKDYERVRKAVFLAERLRYAARREGFDKHIEPQELRVFSPDGLPDFVG